MVPLQKSKGLDTSNHGLKLDGKIKLVSRSCNLKILISSSSYDLQFSYRIVGEYLEAIGTCVGQTLNILLFSLVALIKINMYQTFVFSFAANK